MGTCFGLQAKKFTFALSEAPPAMVTKSAIAFLLAQPGQELHVPGTAGYRIAPLSLERDAPPAAGKDAGSLKSRVIFIGHVLKSAVSQTASLRLA
jgi:hypothetical protein